MGLGFGSLGSLGGVVLIVLEAGVGNAGAQLVDARALGARGCDDLACRNPELAGNGGALRAR